MSETKKVLIEAEQLEGEEIVAVKLVYKSTDPFSINVPFRIVDPAQAVPDASRVLALKEKYGHLIEERGEYALIGMNIDAFVRDLLAAHPTSEAGVEHICNFEKAIDLSALESWLECKQCGRKRQGGFDYHRTATPPRDQGASNES